MGLGFVKVCEGGGVVGEALFDGGVVHEESLDVVGLGAVDLVVVSGSEAGEVVVVKAGIEGAGEVRGRVIVLGGVDAEVEDFEDGGVATGEVEGLRDVVLELVSSVGVGSVGVMFGADFVAEGDGGCAVGAELGPGFLDVGERVAGVQGPA